MSQPMSRAERAVVNQQSRSCSTGCGVPGAPANNSPRSSEHRGCRGGDGGQPPRRRGRAGLWARRSTPSIPGDGTTGARPGGTTAPEPTFTGGAARRRRHRAQTSKDFGAAIAMGVSRPAVAAGSTFRVCCRACRACSEFVDASIQQMKAYGEFAGRDHVAQRVSRSERHREPGARSPVEEVLDADAGEHRRRPPAHGAEAGRGRQRAAELSRRAGPGRGCHVARRRHDRRTTGAGGAQRSRTEPPEPAGADGPHGHQSHHRHRRQDQREAAVRFPRARHPADLRAAIRL